MIKTGSSPRFRLPVNFLGNFFFRSRPLCHQAADEEHETAASTIHRRPHLARSAHGLSHRQQRWRHLPTDDIRRLRLLQTPLWPKWSWIEMPRKVRATLQLRKNSLLYHCKGNSSDFVRPVPYYTARLSRPEFPTPSTSPPQGPNSFAPLLPLPITSTSAAPILFLG
ncbi:hypothetical protein NL676_005273 [Syzygium grande]|nr:hypothetical protein NL676_005273 [Syzygium grande]